ncbi:unnamed protein product [Knipowitschia caucasica]
MAEKGVRLDQDTFSCSICLGLLKNPVTIPCGHSYCMSCVDTHWNEEVGKQSYSCPQCRGVFFWRPPLMKNTLLASLVEEVGRRTAESTENLQDSMCPQHDEVMKMFCRTDQQCICYLCSVDEHGGHDTVMTASLILEKKKELEKNIQMIHERIQERQKQLDLLQCQAGTVICCANTAVDETDTVFTLISRLLERTKAQAKEHIRSQQEAEEHRLKELQNKVQEDITTLKTKCYKLEKLSQCEDLGSILIFPSLSEVEEAPELSISEATPPTFIDLVVNAVADFRDKLQNTDALSRAADEEDPKLSAVAWTTPPQMNEQEQAMQAYQQQLQAMAAETWLNLQNVRTLRAELLYYAQKVTLDPNTAHSQLALSADNSTVRFMSSPQQYPDHPERFTHFTQVLTKEVLTGRCYMEIKVRSEEYFTVAVVNKDIRREGATDECGLGSNTNSWSVDCFVDGFMFWHNKSSLYISGRPSNTIGIYVDVEAGVVCFYSVGREVALIHTINTRFTRPQLAAIWLKEAADCAEICNITPH